MPKQPAEQIAEVNADALSKSGAAVERLVNDNAEAVTDAKPAVLELTKAYQELAIKNAKNLTSAIQALAAVKSPTEFIGLQQRLIREGVEAAVKDSQRIAQLTASVFTAAFQPVKKQIEAAQRPTQH